MLKKERVKVIGVNWNSLSYVILCYAKMRQKVAPFTIVDFWNLRNRQPDIPSKLKKYFTFLTKHGFLTDSGEVDIGKTEYINTYQLTPKGEHELFQCAHRRQTATEKGRSNNGKIGGRHRWKETQI
jgi:hypothetical protein